MNRDALLAYARMIVRLIRPYDRALKKMNPNLRDGQLYYMKDGVPIKPFDRVVIRRRKAKAK